MHTTTPANVKYPSHPAFVVVWGCAEDAVVGGGTTSCLLDFFFFVDGLVFVVDFSCSGR